MSTLALRGNFQSDILESQHIFLFIIAFFFRKSFRGIIDYIFQSKSTLRTTAVLGPIDERWAKDRGLSVELIPNAGVPSDHLALVALMELNVQSFVERLIQRYDDEVRIIRTLGWAGGAERLIGSPLSVNGTFRGREHVRDMVYCETA